MDQPQFGMPLNYYSGQTVTPTNVMVAQPSYPEPITSIPSSADIRRTNKLANFVPSYCTFARSTPPIPHRGTIAPIDPIWDEMLDRYLQRWQNRQRSVRPQSSLTGIVQLVRPISGTGLTSSPSQVAPNEHNASTYTQPNSSSNFIKCLLNIRMIWLICLKNIL